MLEQSRLMKINTTCLTRNHTWENQRSSGVGVEQKIMKKMHDALLAGILTSQVWQENQVKWTYQIMVRRTPSPMVNIPKGHGSFITPSITITPHSNPFAKSIEWLTSHNHTFGLWYLKSQNFFTTSPSSILSNAQLTQTEHSTKNPSPISCLLPAKNLSNIV